MSSENEKLENGTVIANRYTVLRCLGSGGMGAVYLAEDSFLEGDQVAVKVLHPDLVVDAKQSQRFLREVQLMRKVDHPNVVRTFDVGSDASIVYFTMEYVAGKPLEAFIEGQNFPKEKLSKLILDVAAGLEAIHKANIIHRDLKPANILVLENYQSKITDFGVARPEYSDLTAHNEIIGSALYIAPEVWLGTKLTSSVDLYSFGVVLYELTTGVLPFDGDSPASLMRMHLEFKPIAPKELNPEVPVWLNKLILKLLAKTPEERLRDAGELIDYVQTQTGSSEKRSVSEDKFMSSLEKDASKLENFSSDEQKSSTLVMSSDKLKPKAKRTLKQEIIASILCLIIGGVLYLGSTSIIFYLRKSLFGELTALTSDLTSLTFDKLSTVALSPLYLFLLSLEVIFTGASAYLPIGAATGSLKSTLRVFILGAVWSALIVLLYLVIALVQNSSSETQLILSNPDGFSLVLASIRNAISAVTLDTKVWAVQKVTFENGAVFYPVTTDIFSSTINLVLQSVSFLMLGLLSAKLGRFRNWKITGVIVGLLASVVSYGIGGKEGTSLFHHSNMIVLISVIAFYAGILLTKKLSMKSVSQRS
jgi:serine/threonine protein kinase